jgi:uncharacterized protein (TIGR03085 family)
MVSLATLERRALVEALRAAGPDGPTLCEGWTCRDLAAHLVTRERRPDTAPGLVFGPLHGWTARVQAGYARRPFDQLVHLIESGPARLGAFALPGVDSAVNLTEHFVHCEDVRRAAEGWRPRELSAELQQALWRQLTRRGGLFFRRSPVGVRLLWPAREWHLQVKEQAGGQPAVTLAGDPAELTLFAFGRGDHAQVTLEGPAEAVAAVRALRLGV